MLLIQIPKIHYQLSKNPHSKLLGIQNGFLLLNAQKSEIFGTLKMRLHFHQMGRSTRETIVSGVAYQQQLRGIDPFLLSKN